jgi:flagellar assembly factor FliW
MNPHAPDSVVNFPDGLPGFETCRRFILVRSTTSAPFTVLQGIDGQEPPAFVAIDPQLVHQGYTKVLESLDLVRLDAREGEPLLWLSLVSTQADGQATVNLRAPVVINPRSMRGIQLVSSDAAYALDHPLLAA